MNTSKLTAVLLITLGIAGFGAGLGVAASPDAKHKAAHHQARKVAPPRIVGFASDRTPTVRTAQARLDLTPQADARYAEAEPQRPFAGRTIHYDATPSGFPSTVDTVGVSKSF
jgi:hypothetical protein